MKTSYQPGIHIFSLFALTVSLIGSAVFVTPAQAAGICYVKKNASGSNTGATWADAYTDLQSAIANACTGIWVAAGVYKPALSDRTISFNLEDGTAIYGGFPNTGNPVLADRDPGTNPTILSGDLNGNDSGFTNNGENSYHVVTGATGATLDGFTITGGNANGTAPHNNGGGMIISSNNPTITNVTFIGNSAANWGGGLINSFSSSTITNTTFTGNTANIGGGMYNQYSDSIFTNLTISDNSGGGMAFYTIGSVTLKNVLSANNTGGDCQNPAGSVSFNPNSSNNLIEDNSGLGGCLYLTDGVDGNIIGVDPNLGALTGSPAYYPLNSGSPAIDTGTNTGCPAADQRGVSRPQNGRCDIGAYEYQEPFAPTVSTFTVVTPTNNRNLTITAFTGIDNVGVTGFKVTTSSTPPLAGDAGWSAVTPLHYMLPGPGSTTLYPWVKDADGNVSRVFGAPFSVTVIAPIQRAKNGGFNVYPTATAKLPTSWVKSATFAATDGKDTSIKKEGAASVTITGAPAKVKTLTQTLAFSGVQGDRLTFSFYVRGSAIPVSPALCQGQVFLYSGTTKIMTRTLPCPTGTFAAFQKKTVTFNAPSAFNKVIIKFTYSKSGGTVWFDLASLLK